MNYAEEMGRVLEEGRSETTDERTTTGQKRLTNVGRAGIRHGFVVIVVGG